MRQANDFTTATGYLLRVNPTCPPDVVSLFGDQRIQRVGEFHNRSWSLYQWSSAKALLGEDLNFSSPPFRYPIAARPGRRLLLISDTRVVVDELLKHVRDAHTTIRKVNIFINNLVKDIVLKKDRDTDPGQSAATDGPSEADLHHLDAALPADGETWTLQSVGELGLTFVHGRLSGYGESMRSMSLYGEDLSEGELFRNLVDRKRITAHSCGIRHLLDDIELARLSFDGAISFNLGPSSTTAQEDDSESKRSRKHHISPSVRLKEIEIMISFLLKQKYMSEQW